MSTEMRTAGLTDAGRIFDVDVGPMIVRRGCEINAAMTIFLFALECAGCIVNEMGETKDVLVVL